MASSAAMDTPPDSSHDDRRDHHQQRQRPVRASRGGGGGGQHGHSRNNSSAANVGHGLRPPSPPLEKHQLQDEPYISPESDTDDDDTTAPPVKAPQMPPAVPDSPSRRSPGKSRPPVANAGQRDSWGAGPPPPQQQQHPQQRPLSMASAADDGRRHSGSHGNSGGAARYRRHEQMNGGRPHSGQHSGSRGDYSKSRHPDQPPGRSGPPPQNRRSHGMNADPRHRAPSPSEASPTKSHPINRLESPGIMESVLQPLKHKLNEYDRLMTQSQTEMTQLDEELRALQEKRRQAEDRYLDAKDKHDEYERQHEDVERALRGEVSPAQANMHAPLYAPQMMATSGPVQRPATMESYGGGGGGGMGERRPTSNPVSNRSSRTRQLGTMDKLKLRFLGS